jgi:hypothetical protein
MYRYIFNLKFTQNLQCLAQMILFVIKMKPKLRDIFYSNHIIIKNSLIKIAYVSNICYCTSFQDPRVSDNNLNPTAQVNILFETLNITVFCCLYNGHFYSSFHQTHKDISMFVVRKQTVKPIIYL